MTDQLVLAASLAIIINELLNIWHPQYRFLDPLHNMKNNKTRVELFVL